jgi:serine/threonine-protein kinase
MALAFQGQGKLDAAWQKFQALPASATLLDDLLALAGAFEKANKPKKAIEVLRVVQERHPGYRDVDARMAQARSRAVLARAAEAKPEAPSGPKFGAFVAEREIGRGAVGAVYLGRDPVIGREVAIKTLPLDGEFASPESKARLFDEVRAAGALSHPNIVTLYDVGEAQGVAYVAMEYLKGGTLAAHLAPERLLPAAEAAEIAARAAEALGHAHREGVLHRDVRPGNIMVQPETGLVKVTDFGLGRLAEKGRGTESPYLAPEQRAGGVVDGRSDLYALGVTLCQLLTGRPPAELADAAAEMPEGFGAVVLRAVAVNPGDRFQTGDEFAAALRAAALASAAQTVDIEL